MRNLVMLLLSPDASPQLFNARLSLLNDQKIIVNLIEYMVRMGCTFNFVGLLGCLFILSHPFPVICIQHVPTKAQDISMAEDWIVYLFFGRMFDMSQWSEAFGGQDETGPWANRKRAAV